eukprot:gene1538-5111_t
MLRGVARLALLWRDGIDDGDVALGVFQGVQRLAVVSPVGPVPAAELPRPLIPLCMCRGTQCAHAEDLLLAHDQVRWLSAGELLDFLRDAVSSEVIDGVLLSAAAAQAECEAAVPDIAHRARCRRARWNGEPPPRREDAALFDRVRPDDPDADLFASVVPRAADAGLFEAVHAESESSGSLFEDVDPDGMCDSADDGEPAPADAELEDFVAASDDDSSDLQEFDLPERRICARCGKLA